MSFNQKLPEQTALLVMITDFNKNDDAELVYTHWFRFDSLVSAAMWQADIRIPFGV